MTGRLSNLLRTRGLRKGVMGGDRRWLTIWAVVTTARTMQKFLKPRAVVERFELRPGETVVITDLGVPDQAS